MIIKGSEKSQARQCLGFCPADFPSFSAVQTFSSHYVPLMIIFDKLQCAFSLTRGRLKRVGGGGAIEIGVSRGRRVRRRHVVVLVALPKGRGKFALPHRRPWNEEHGVILSFMDGCRWLLSKQLLC